MADRFLIPAGGVWADALSNIWAAGTGGAADGGGIGGGDTAYCDANSGNLTVTGAAGDCACDVLDMTGYTGTGDWGVAHRVNVAGNTTLEGTFTDAGGSDILIGGSLVVIAGTDFSGFSGTIDMEGLGTPTITTNGVTLPHFAIVNPGVTSCTLADALTCDDFSMGTATSKFDTGANAMVCNDFQLADGTFAGSGTLAVSGGFDVSIFLGVYSHTGTITFSAAAGNPTLAADGTPLPSIVVNNNGVASFKLVGDLACGALTLTLGKLDDDKAGTGGDIACDSFGMAGGALEGSGDNTIAGDVAISGGSLAGFSGTFDASSAGAHDIQIDPTTPPAAAGLTLGGNRQLTSIVTIDGTGFTVTADGAIITGACTVQDVVASVSLWVPTGIDGAGNINVHFGYGITAAIVTILTADGTVGPLISTHGLTTADAVTFRTTNTLPTSAPPGFAAGTTYYVRAVSATTFTVHATAADATGNLNILNFTDTGTGVHTCMPTARRKEWVTGTVVAATDVWTSTGYRIVPNILPQGALVPAIVYQRISTPRIRSLGGTSDLAYPRFQITSWAATYAEARTLADAVRNALDDYLGAVEGETIDDAYIDDEGDAFEAAPDVDARRRHGVRQDFVIWHRE